MYPLRQLYRQSACLRIATFTRHLIGARMCSSSNHMTEALLETKNNAGIITMNRPKALNALNLPMIRKIYPQLKQWDMDPNIGVILIKGTGDKAFCAGGDVRAIAEAGLRGEDLTKDFFREEYMLNYAIGTLKTPYVALIHGITMGGGVGLSVHGRYRVATEKTTFAMPETAIGFFPDVGGAHALPRLSGKLGLFLALTGQRLKGYNVKLAGIATHYVTLEKISALEEALLNLKDPQHQIVQDVLNDFDKQCSPNQRFVLDEHMDSINRCFSQSSVEEIISALEEEGSPWAAKQIENLNRMSPTSLKVTLQQLEEGSRLDLGECLKMEYRMSQTFMENKDFYEGIRAVLVDKDNSPKWNPSSLKEVSKESVESYFKPIGERELVL
ncbi:predicted protein [Nematostella vectensis]|uniref:3-hydroxyisobutyryl-CoA hydrolase, mitochondrial n=1 Tax=Nematostella vectensis TaxID=45351 RepID=A7RHZ5_NEMVE|nr:3-hydroxyisobutyryl-CoA hydrolase, mitochondrial isoform X2 [Nematostella vectensis]EDO48943.1 predicted protein [Nematostella vectensis]|eukprot:XP_001641006.1 predicted protein [Nematostella vectensis]